MSVLALVRPAAGLEPWWIDRFDSDITIQPDASMRIVESIDADFSGSAMHGIFREIPVRYAWDSNQQRVYRLTFLSVTDAVGKAWPYTLEDNGANQGIRIGDPNRTVTGVQSYRLTYLVQGALNPFPDHDELYWNVHGFAWSVLTRSVSATVHLAGGGLSGAACFEGPAGSTRPCTHQDAADAVAYSATRQIDPGQDMTIGVRIRKGAVAEPVTLLEPRPRGVDRWFELTPTSSALAATALVVGLWLVGWLWWRRGRDLRDGRSPTIVPEYEPPDRLRPAQLGLIQDERADAKDLTATLIDLAARGYLRITEIPKRGLLGSDDWELAKLRDATGLEPYEATLLGAIFAGGDTVKLSQLKGTVAPKLREAEGQLYADSVTRGWFPTDPSRARGIWALLGIGVILAGGALAFLLGSAAGLGLVGVAVVAAGMVLLVLSPAMSRRSAAGHELLRRTLGFRRYIETAEKDRAAFAEKEGLFSEYLPYAIVFGCVRRWAAAFAGLDATRATVSGWYVGNRPFDAVMFAGRLETFSSMVTSTVGYTPGASGGSFAGGGGSSGGGGGGGGGGGW